MTELYINQKLNQLLELGLELDYGGIAESPLEYVDDSIKFFIETPNVVNDLIDNLFDGDEEAYQIEHDKHNSASGLFGGLNKIAKKQGMLIYPISKYEHSQVAYELGTGEGWDCGTVGFVLVDLKQAKKEYRFNNKTEIENYLGSLLEDYTDYANGYVYCATTYELDSKGEKEDIIDEICNLLSNDTNIKGLLELGVIEGELKDWKEAKEQANTSYTLA